MGGVAERMKERKKEQGRKWRGEKKKRQKRDIRRSDRGKKSESERIKKKNKE